MIIVCGIGWEFCLHGCFPWLWLCEVCHDGVCVCGSFAVFLKGG